jgi:hypothetical protein
MASTGGSRQAALRNNSTALSLGLPQPTLRSTQQTGFAPSATATGDFNGDGKLDWAVTMAGDDSVWVYTGNGNGTWQLPIVLTLTGKIPVGIVAVDLRHSGKPDLVVAENGTSTLGILLNNGDGTFQPEVEIALPSPPQSIVAGDFNGDGKPDIVVGNTFGFFHGPVSFLAGDGAGHLGSPVANLADDADGIQIAIGDFNNDGKLDLVVTGVPGDSLNAGSRVLMGNGDGTFTSTQLLYEDLPDFWLLATSAATGDVDHDGCEDIVVFDGDANALFAKGNCDGTFQVAQSYYEDSTSYALGDSAISGSLVDVNGDGNLDLVAGGGEVFNPSSSGYNAGSLISVSLGDGKGHFGPQATVYRVGANNLALAVADLEGNGHPDILAPSYFASTFTLLRNDGKGHFGPPSGATMAYPGGGPFATPQSQPAVLDLNGDGRPDMAITMNQKASAFGLAVFLGQPDGSLSVPAVSSILPSTDYSNIPYSFAFGDFRATGKPDLILAASDSYNNSYYYAQNDGAGGFNAGTTVATSDGSGQIAVGDFNRDGKLDFVIAGNGTGSSAHLTMYLGKGDGTFSPQPAFQVLQNGQPITSSVVAYITAVDLNRDGKLDLLIHYESNATAGQLIRVLGDGNGGWANTSVAFAGIPDFNAVDLNHDGCPDLIVGDSGESRPGFSVYLCQPDGSFSGPTAFAPYTNFPLTGYPLFSASYSADPSTTLSSRAPVIGDFDGDGNIDVALTQVDGFGGTNLSFAMGRGDGTFELHLLQLPLDEGLPPMFAGDVNGDGLSDLIQIDTLTSGVTVMPSTAARATFGLEFRALPVSGTAHLRLLLDQPAAKSQTYSLTSSNPSISIPSHVVVSAGADRADVDFTLPNSYDYKQTFLITAASGTESHVALGYAVPEAFPVLALSPDFLDFGSVDVNVQSAPQTFTVANIGNAPVNNLSYANEPIVSTTCGTTLGAGATCEFQLAETPTAPGSSGVGGFQVRGDGVSAEIIWFLYGVAINTTATVSTNTLNFQAAFGQVTTAQSITITNTGSQPLAFTLISATDPAFSQTANTCNRAVAPGSSCSVSYTFTPPSTPTELSVTSAVTFEGDFPAPLTVALQGTIASGLATISPTSINFGNQALGTTSNSQSVIISNTGTSPLYLSSVMTTPGFSTGSACSNTALAPAQTCSLDVYFAPNQSGVNSGSLTLISTSAAGNLVIPLAGVGGAAIGLSLGSGSSNTFSLAGGQSAQESLIILEAYSAPVTISCVAKGLTCSASPRIVSGPTSSATVQVLFTANTQNAAVLKTFPSRWLATTLAVVLIIIPRRSRKLFVPRCLAALLLTLGGLGACGGTGGGAPSTPSGPAPTPSGVYAATVTASDGTNSASQNFTITVK